MPALSQPMARPLRTIVWQGVSMGLLLGAGLVMMLANDYQRRHEAAQRQSSALATSSQRLLRLELRNLERAMRGIAADGAQLFERVPAQAPDLLDEAIDGVLQRHAELESIVVVDQFGRALTSGGGDLTLPLWIVENHRGAASQLYLGPPQDLGMRRWVVPLALRMGDDRWLLSRLHASELQSVISGLDIGYHGVISISDGAGHVLARSPDNEGLTGKRYKLQRRDLVGRDSVTPLGIENSPIDQVERISTLTTLAEYPLAVYAGLARQDVLAPWWPYVQASLGLYLLYWGAFALVYSSLRRATRRQDAMSAELRTGHAELRMAHQVGKICTWTVDEDAAVLRWSPLAREIFGIPLDSLPVAEFFDRVHQDDAQRLRDAFHQAFAGNGVLDEMFRIVLPGGTTHWVSARGQQVGGIDQERRMIGALTDVSERVQALARAQQAERQFRLLFDRNPAPFWVFDPDTLRFLEVNEAAVRQYGYSRDEFLAMSILDIRPREGWEEIRGAIANATSGDLQDAKVRLHRRKDGTVFEVRAHLARLDFDGREACLVLAEDISDRMAYERDLAYHATHHCLRAVPRPATGGRYTGPRGRRGGAAGHGQAPGRTGRALRAAGLPAGRGFHLRDPR